VGDGRGVVERRGYQVGVRPEAIPAVYSGPSFGNLSPDPISDPWGGLPHSALCRNTDTYGQSDQYQITCTHLSDAYSDKAKSSGQLLKFKLSHVRSRYRRLPSASYCLLSLANALTVALLTSSQVSSSPLLVFPLQIHHISPKFAMNRFNSIRTYTRALLP